MTQLKTAIEKSQNSALEHEVNYSFIKQIKTHYPFTPQKRSPIWHTMPDPYTIKHILTELST